MKNDVLIYKNIQDNTPNDLETDIEFEKLKNELHKKIFGIDIYDDKYGEMANFISNNSFYYYSFLSSLTIFFLLVTYNICYLCFYILKNIILFNLIKLIVFLCLLKYIVGYLIKINKVNLKDSGYFLKDN